ncbi:MAG TPA: FHA domain-containing protein, partial [Ktedonobacterales bacterium]
MPDTATPHAVSLAFLTGPLAGKTLLIEKTDITMGRGLENDVVISADRRVSRRHLRLYWADNGWRVKNISQGNTIQVDGESVTNAALAPGATVRLGEATSFTVRASAAAEDAAEESAFSTAPTVAYADLSPDLSPDEERKRAALVTAPPALPTQTAEVAPQPSRVDATQVARLDEISLPSLEVTSNTRDGKQVFELASPVINIGRDAANDLVINDRIISGRHLQIVREGDEYVLIHPHPDRASTLNGLLYQGRKIRGDEQFRKPLTKGDIFRIGDENGTLVTLTYHDGTDSAQVAAPAIEPIRLGAAEITIGRKTDNTITLAHPQVSGHHATLAREGATYRITDMNSTNHVYVNGEIVASQTLKTGDEIRIGPYRFVYEGNQLKQYDESSFIRIDGVGLKRVGTNNVTLLDDISVSIPPRSFVALVGGSGAGKSTLLDALNGLRPAQAGSVLYNGRDYYHNIAMYSSQIGYVPQDDIVHRDLTVERALYYAAKIRLPSDFTDEQIQQRINEVLDEVELTHRRTLMVRDLSGGQRKRVSIALELLANPSIFFLDEPTSGLDPGLDRKMMFLLRRLADRGHTIVLVTHATTNINSCDYVCFLCAGGRLAYFGPPEEAKAYFGKSDFAEIYSSLEATDDAPEIPADAQARFRASQEYQRYVVAPTREAHNGAHATTAAAPTQQRATARRGRGWSQFLLLSARY